MMARTRFPVWLWAIVFLALAALACDPYTITGITCLQEREDGTILAREETNSFISADGGLTWQENGLISPLPMEGCARFYSTPGTWIEGDPDNPYVMYRFNPEISIESSEDRGGTWHKEIDLSGTEARTVYYVGTRHDGFDYRSGPFAAVRHSKTDNLVVAMGYEGVLVRTPDARWTWVAVGPYYRADMRNLGITLPLISWEITVALVLGLVVASTLPEFSKGNNFRLIVACILGSILATVLITGFRLAIMTSVFYLLPSIASEFLRAVAGIDVLAMLLLGPALIPLAVAVRTHQANKLAFVWAGLAWAYFLVLFIVGSVISGRSYPY